MGRTESSEKVTQPLLRQYSCMTLGLNSVVQNHETSPANACQGALRFCQQLFPSKDGKVFVNVRFAMLLQNLWNSVCFGGEEMFKLIISDVNEYVFLVFWFHPKLPIYVSCSSPRFQRKRNGVRIILTENKFPPNWVLGGSDPAPNSAVSRPFSPKV